MLSHPNRKGRGLDGAPSVERFWAGSMAGNGLRLKPPPAGVQEAGTAGPNSFQRLTRRCMPSAEAHPADGSASQLHQQA